MAIDRWTNQGPGLPVVRQPTPGPGIAVAGEALTRAGLSAMHDISQDQRRAQAEAAARAEEAQRQRDTLGVERTVAEAETWADQTFKTLAEQAPEGADGFEQQVGEAWTARRADMLANAQGLSPYARELLATRLDTRVGSRLSAQAADFATGSRVAKQISDFDVIMSARANRVISDPAAYDDEAQDMAGLLTQLRLPPAKLSQVAQSARATLARAAVAGQIDRDPAMALQWLDSGRFDKALAPDDKVRLRNAGEVELRRRAGEVQAAASLAKAEMRADLSDMVTALRAGRRVDYDPNRILAVLGEKNGRAALNDLDQAGRFGADAAAIQYASPDEIAGMMVQRQARQGGDVHPVTGRPVIHNQDGSISTEESITVTDERLNAGRPTNIPSIWGGKRPPPELDDVARENWAIEQALKSGQRFQAFDSIDQAVKAAKKRTAMLGQTANDVRGFAERQQELSALAGMVAERNRALADDPAGYVAASPMVGQRWQEYQSATPDKKTASFGAYVTATLAEQERLGVPEPMRRILPKGQAALQVAALASAKPEDAADTMAQQAALYGRHWPAAYRDLVKAGLSRDYQVLATTEDPVGRANLAAALAQDKDALRQAVADDAREIDQTVAGAMAPLYRSLSAAPDGQDIAASYERSARLLAYRYAAGGMDAGDAATRAASDVALGRWDFVESGDGGQALARTPKGMGGAVQRWAGSLLTRLQPSDLADPGDPRGVATGRDAAARQAIALASARRGAWLTNEDGTGWFRVHEDGSPVRLSDGQRLEFRFDQMEAGTINAVRIPQVRYGG